MTQKKINPRHLLRGSDGALLHDGDILLEVNEFSCDVTVTNTGYQPVRSTLEVGVLTAIAVGLTFTEAIMKDARLLAKFFRHIKGEEEVEWEFMGELHGHDGTVGRYTLGACEPDGTINIFNASPGDLIRRPWAFRVNEIPDLQDVLGGAL